MWYLWIGVLAGLSAAPHCAGMCGAFPLYLARGAGKGHPLLRQTLYAGGRTLTYVFVGALAGALGRRVVQNPAVAHSQGAFAYLLGGALVALGLAMLGAFASVRLPLRGLEKSGVLRDLRTTFLHSPGPGASLLLGVATGFLPCPVTVAMGGVAAASRSVALGMMAMAGMGLGTSLVLLFIGFSGTLVDLRFRRIGLRGAGAIVVVLGLVTLLRPTPVLHRILPHVGGADVCCETHR